MQRSNSFTPQKNGTPRMPITPSSTRTMGKNQISVNQDALSSAMQNLSVSMRNESETAFSELHHRIEHEKQEELMTTRNQYESLMSFMLAKIEQSSAEMIADLIQQQHLVQEEWIQEHKEAQEVMIERIHAEHEAAMDKIKADLVAYDGHMMIREQQAKRAAAALLDQKQIELDELRREKDCEIASINLQNSKLLLTQQEGFSVELARQRESFLTQLADAAADLEAMHKEFEHRLILERQEVANEVETASAEMVASMVEQHMKYNESLQQECDEKVRQAQAKLSMKVGAFITGGSEYEELLAENIRLKDPLLAQELHQSLQLENETLQLRIVELTDALNNALSTIETERSLRDQLIEEHNRKVEEHNDKIEEHKDQVAKYEAEMERLIHVREEKEEEVEMFRSETQRLNQALGVLTEQLDSLRRGDGHGGLEGNSRSGNSGVEGNSRSGNSEVEGNSGGGNAAGDNNSGVGDGNSGGGGDRTRVKVGIRGGTKSSIITGGKQRKHSDVPVPVSNTTPSNDTTSPIMSTITNTDVAIDSNPSPVPVPSLDVAAFFPSESSHSTSRRRVSDHSQNASPFPNATAPSSSDNMPLSVTSFTPTIAPRNATPSTPVHITPIALDDGNNATTDTPTSEHTVITTPTSNHAVSTESTPIDNSSNAGGSGSSGRGSSSSKSRVQELIAKMNRGKLGNSNSSNNNNNNGNMASNQDL